MKQKINQLFLVAALLCGAMSLGSCQGLIDAIVGEHADNPTQPTPTPTPTPTPAAVVKATDLLQEAQKEGAIITIWYHYEGELYRAVFKKVGDEYVRQNSVAGTRADNDEKKTELIEHLDCNDESWIIISIEEAFDDSRSVRPVLKVKIDPFTGIMYQEMNNPDTNLASVAVGKAPQEAIVSDIKSVIIHDDGMLVPTAWGNLDLKLQSVSEIQANATEQGIPLNEAVGAVVYNYQQKVVEDWNNGTSKLPEIYFPDPTPSVTWSPTASENTYQQALKTEGEGTVKYSISTDINNTCEAEINTSTGEVTFEKPGEVKVEATFTNNGGSDYTASYTLTVTSPEGTDPDNDQTDDATYEKQDGSISYAIKTVEKVVGDDSFTNALTIVGNGTVTYTSDNEAVAKVDRSTGEVTIIGAGEATITATVADSDTYHYATNTASYKLTVTGVNGTLGEAVGYEWGGDLSGNN